MVLIIVLSVTQYTTNLSSRQMIFEIITQLREEIASCHHCVNSSRKDTAILMHESYYETSTMGVHIQKLIGNCTNHRNSTTAYDSSSSNSCDTCCIIISMLPDLFANFPVSVSVPDTSTSTFVVPELLDQLLLFHLWVLL